MQIEGVDAFHALGIKLRVLQSRLLRPRPSQPAKMLVDKQGNRDDEQATIQYKFDGKCADSRPIGR